MGFKQLSLERSYISCGNNNISHAFLIPALKCTRLYRRSVGFFSSGVFQTIVDGVVTLARNGGSVQLIASPKLSEDDIAAIKAGYAKRDKAILDHADEDFFESITQLGDNDLILLSELIANKVLDIKIAVTENIGAYHDKFGILEDFDGNTIAFYGSANSTLNGYQNNYEKIRLARGWIPGECESVRDELQEFDSLWNDKNEFVKVYDYYESAKKNIFQIVEQRKEGTTYAAPPITLRDYQQEAIQAWVDNGYHGFFVMATGTGKTWTAIFAAKRLFEDNPAMLVVCAPYKHLIEQWADDLKKIFRDANIILVSSENPSWESQIAQEIIRQRYNPNQQLVIISTIASFRTKRFMDSIGKSNQDKLLIVDEAHRFSDRPESLKDTFKYMLGLSATPYSGTSAQSGRELMQFFGGQVFNLPIEDALKKGFLVPYYYKPIFVYATEEEERQFNVFSGRIASCFHNNRCINPDLLVRSLRGRLRVISMAEDKDHQIDSIISSLSEKDHFVVYCGDGKLFDNRAGEELRHIQSIKRVLTAHGYKSSQFTAKENMKDRMQLVDAFNKGEISALAAIRCLDEGINIPSIKSALILSSNDDYREFVQRRGRILRPYPGKTSARIYDVIVLPSPLCKQWAKIEFRRFYEYARLSINGIELQSELDSLLLKYDLSMEDIDTYDYDDVEVQLDE